MSLLWYTVGVHSHWHPWCLLLLLPPAAYAAGHDHSSRQLCGAVIWNPHHGHSLQLYSLGASDRWGGDPGCISDPYSEGPSRLHRPGESPCRHWEHLPELPVPRKRPQALGHPNVQRRAEESPRLCCLFWCSHLLLPRKDDGGKWRQWNICLAISQYGPFFPRKRSGWATGMKDTCKCK